MRNKTLAVLLVGFLSLMGCSATPDPKEVEKPMALELIQGPWKLDIIQVNGLRIPHDSLNASLKIVRTYVSDPIDVAYFTNTKVAVPTDGFITEEQLNLILALRKTAGPQSVTIIVLPAMKMYTRGFATSLTDGGHLIVVYDTAITEASNIFISRERVYEVVLTHEFGHTLGIPYRKDHKWSENHCTNASCVMYPRPDWNSVWMTIFNLGLPDTYCDICTKELTGKRP